MISETLIQKLTSEGWQFNDGFNSASKMLSFKSPRMLYPVNYYPDMTEERLFELEKSYYLELVFDQIETAFAEASGDLMKRVSTEIAAGREVPAELQVSFTVLMGKKQD